MCNSKVYHFEAESVELHSLNALVDVVGKPGLAYFVEANIVTESDVLVELTVEVVDIAQVGRVVDELGPVVGLGEGSVLTLVLVDDLREVPGEGQHVGMLLL